MPRSSFTCGDETQPSRAARQAAFLLCEGSTNDSRTTSRRAHRRPPRRPRRLLRRPSAPSATRTGHSGSSPPAPATRSPTSGSMARCRSASTRATHRRPATRLPGKRRRGQQSPVYNYEYDPTAYRPIADSEPSDCFLKRGGWNLTTLELAPISTSSSTSCRAPRRQSRQSRCRYIYIE